MRVQFLSDLHTELPENMGFIKAHPFDVTGDVLVLAGDIGYLNEPPKKSIKLIDIEDMG